MKSSAQICRIGVIALILTGLTACDPHDTNLPLDLKDIPKIQAKLDELPADERQLVLDYLNRSKGDVLPAKYADPDAPLTARTFGEAIKLQREFSAKQAVENARLDALHEEREAAMDPLREILQIELANREILTVDEVEGRHPEPGQAINDKPVLVVTFRLSNTGSETITDASGAVTLRSEADPKSLMGLFHCYIPQTGAIEPGQSIERRCANPNLQASQADEEFVAMSDTSLVQAWEPKSITFANGEVLKPAQ